MINGEIEMGRYEASINVEYETGRPLLGPEDWFATAFELPPIFQRMGLTAVNAAISEATLPAYLQSGEDAMNLSSPLVVEDFIHTGGTAVHPRLVPLLKRLTIPGFYSKTEAAASSLVFLQGLAALGADTIDAGEAFAQEAKERHIVSRVMNMELTNVQGRAVARELKVSNRVATELDVFITHDGTTQPSALAIEAVTGFNDGGRRLNAQLLLDTTPDKRKPVGLTAAYMWVGPGAHISAAEGYGFDGPLQYARAFGALANMQAAELSQGRPVPAERPVLNLPL